MQEHKLRGSLPKLPLYWHFTPHLADRHMGKGVLYLIQMTGAHLVPICLVLFSEFCCPRERIYGLFFPRSLLEFSGDKTTSPEVLEMTKAWQPLRALSCSERARRWFCGHYLYSSQHLVAQCYLKRLKRHYSCCVSGFYFYWDELNMGLNLFKRETLGKRLW